MSVSKDGETYRITNDFQRNVTLDGRTAVSALCALLEDIVENGMAPDPRNVDDATPFLELEGIEIYGAEFSTNRIAWIVTPDGQKMYVRNQHHAEGLVRELQRYATSVQYDTTDTDPEVQSA